MPQLLSQCNRTVGGVYLSAECTNCVLSCAVLPLQLSTAKQIICKDEFALLLVVSFLPGELIRLHARSHSKTLGLYLS